tara:strand:+ start:1299 stop:1757 length:459 start_codon:yes stop_codon:yes gene_type:complete
MSTITATNLHGDTIRKTGGSLGVDIRVKNTSVYESDGGTSVTQNLVQGLAKAWFACDNMAIIDSLNSAGLTDNGTGDLTLTVTNAMGNANYSTGMGSGGSATTDGSMRLVEGIDATTARTASAIRLRQGYKPASLVKFDDSLSSIQFFGDLA